MTSNLQAGVHFRDALEHSRLIDMHFVLHKQLIVFIHTNEIASKHFKTTFTLSLPSCYNSIVLVGLFSRSCITWAA